MSEGWMEYVTPEEAQKIYDEAEDKPMSTGQ